ncbi:MAG: hypothetical protein WC916_02430 [Candidatus Woesearchaeota archaeon]
MTEKNILSSQLYAHATSLAALEKILDPEDSHGLTLLIYGIVERYAIRHAFRAADTAQERNNAIKIVANIVQQYQHIQKVQKSYTIAYQET